ncbi:uncharacterized protein LOC132711464 [Pantherophis guttatus]|uniref:Interleukin-2 receptor subunit alpha n=1 Tax=Pantherophis guttatus TaxID=94885 RepID=A0ABM3ZDX0_PANGU|nr:uncharacterized protein LOC132711464 [Pantherophis guttatus]
MTDLFLEFGLLLLCSIFQYSEGLGNDVCPEPNISKFAEYYMDRYVVGTWARYYCDEGYKRPAGVNNIIRCKNDSGVVQWMSSSQPVCIAFSDEAPTTDDTNELPTRLLIGKGQSSTEKWKNSSIGPKISTSTPTAVEGFCGIPVPLKHATVKVTKYKVGQKLTFKCLNESQAWAPISGITTCENSNGVAVWSSLNPQCTEEVSFNLGEQFLNPAILFIMAAGTMVFIL